MFPSTQNSKGDIDDHTGTLTLSNMEIPRLASASATSCGVDTITAPGKTLPHSDNYTICLIKQNWITLQRDMYILPESFRFWDMVI